MRKLLYIFIPLFLALVVILISYFFFLRDDGKGALQVTSTPKSNVFLNGQLIGQTPLCKCEADTMVKLGEYTIKIVPLEGNFPPFENRITIHKAVLTAVDRDFAEGAGSSGAIITLEQLPNKKEIGLLTLSFPDNATVSLDNNKIGKSPILLNNITESDHEIKLEKSGYKEKTLRIKTALGYKLVATVFLGIDNSINTSSSSASTNNLDYASSSANIKITKITILETPTGFLRVRDEASLNALEIARINPGQTFNLIEEQEGWFKIKLDSGKEGWVSAQYAKKE